MKRVISDVLPTAVTIRSRISKTTAHTRQLRDFYGDVPLCSPRKTNLWDSLVLYSPTRDAEFSAYLNFFSGFEYDPTAD